MTSVARVFRRTRFTWLTYLSIFYFGVSQSIPGPAIPFLRDELGLSRTVAGMHSSMFAIGSLCVGFFGDRYADRFGSRFALWSGGIIATIGLSLFVLGQHPIVTLIGTLFLGLGAGELAMMVTATQGDEHQENRAAAITEGTMFASAGVVTAPILVGQLQAAGFGWRSSVLVLIAYLVVMIVVFGRTTFPKSLSKTETTETQRKGRLPALYWIYGAVLFMAVAIEWSLMFWTAEYLIDTVNMAPELASTLVSVFVGAIFLGRLIGARFTPYYKLGHLLLGAMGIIIFGFPFFWLGTTAMVKVIGMFIIGFGTANLFPLTLSACTLSAPTQTNRASARISILGGGAILISPQLLGAIADATSIQVAFGMILMLAVISVFIILYANRRAEAVV